MGGIFYTMLPIDYARRLERIESLKAKERQATSTGGTDPQLRPNLDEAENKRTDDLVAKKLGIGGKDTYRKDKYIVDNKDSLTLEDFARRKFKTTCLDIK